jgi:hypothetical protein
MGAEVWVPFEQKGEMPYSEVVEEGFQRSDWVVLVMTPNAVASKLVQFEMDRAINLRMTKELREIIPVVAVDCSQTKVSPMWDSLHQYDATVDYQRALHGLGNAMGLDLKAPAALIPPPQIAAPKPVAPPTPGLELLQMAVKYRRLLVGGGVATVLLVLVAYAFTALADEEGAQQSIRGARLRR